jgi:antitoxin component of RelBE/YafQ-DinJ toxin-antitoxin module
MDNVYIGTRIETELKELVQAVCKCRGEDVSDFVRRAVRKELASLGYMPLETEKALGIERA